MPALDAVKCDIPNYKLVVRPHPGAPDAALTCQQIAKSSGLLSELDDKDDNILDLLLLVTVCLHANLHPSSTMFV